MMITIDGTEVPFTTGQTILDAAREAGVYIPTLCAHKELPPFGACRLCIVKVDGMRGFPPACTTPASDGMVVHSTDPEVMTLRKNILRLILIEHPHSCIVCDVRDDCEKLRGGPVKAGRITGCSMCPNRPICEIREVCDYLGMDDMDIPMEYKNLPVERFDPFFDRDYNLCILCGRCVRMCQQVRGVGAIAFTKRSHETKVGTIFGRTHLEGKCRFCGACIDACPTGALSPKGSKWHGKADSITESICTYCSMNCSMIYEEKWGRVMAALPDREKGYSKAYACVYGRFSIPAFVNGSERLHYPLIRKGGRLSPVSWEEAYQYINQSLQRFAPEEIGFLVSPYLTNESAYVTQKFARDTMGTSNIDVLSPFGRLVHQFLAKNQDAATNWSTMDDIEDADWVFLLNNDMVFSHPGMPVALHKARERGAHIITVDDGSNELDTEADIQVHIEPGSLRAFVSGLQKMILDEVSEAELEEEKGFIEFRRSLDELRMINAVRLTGVFEKKYEEIAKIMLSSGKGVIVFGSRIMEDPDPQQILSGIRNILLLLQIKGGFLPLLEEGNIRGVCDAGCISGFKPGWEKERSRGKDYIRMMAGIRRGDVKALFIDDASISPELIRGTRFIVLSEVFPSALDSMADVILPSAMFTEEDGHYTSLEGRELELVKAVDPPGMAQPQWKIITELANTCGATGFDFESSNAIRVEMGNTMSFYAETKRPKFMTSKHFLTIKEPADIHLGEYTPSVVRFRGTRIHELVKDLQVYLEENERIPKRGPDQQSDGTVIKGGSR